MRIPWLPLVIGGLFGLPFSIAAALFPMKPEEVESQAALWLSSAGFSEWAEGLTRTTDAWVTGGLVALAAASFGLVCFGVFQGAHRALIHKTQDSPPFDMPILEAVDHYVRTFPHSYQDGADRHAFEVLHKAMCAGKLPVIGTRGEDAPSERISARRCKRLKPTMIVVPRNWASPRGFRFDLVDKAAVPEVPEPLVESDEPIGFTGLRVRSADLYRLWPTDEREGE